MDESLDVFTPDNQISSDHLVAVCKYRQGEGCCRYIYFPQAAGDFYCAKKIPNLKLKIDDLAEGMTAKGDNCPGLS